MKRYRFGKRNEGFEKFKTFAVFFAVWNLIGFGVYKFMVYYGPGGKDKSNPDPNDTRTEAEAFNDVWTQMFAGDKPVRKYTFTGLSDIKVRDFSSRQEMSMVERFEREQAKKEKEAQLKAKETTEEITYA